MSDEHPVDDTSPPDEPAELLDPREVARERRRDRDADAARRDLMRPGMGKVFKQILDRQAREAAEIKARRAQRSTRHSS